MKRALSFDIIPNNSRLNKWLVDAYFNVEEWEEADEYTPTFEEDVFL